MRLVELNPKWITPNVFVFDCPHCQQILLSCKNVVISEREQYEHFEKALGEDWHMIVVPCRNEFAWAFSGDSFETMSITPSLDASASGHWHGLITNGQVA